MEKNVLIIGGGVAGMEAAAHLSEQKINVTLVEKENHLGGHLTRYHVLFPSKKKASDVFDYLNKKLDSQYLNVLLNSEVNVISKNGKGFYAKINNQPETHFDAILLATGFDLFNAELKEEYGYHIYNNVIKAVELEDMFNKGEILTSYGKKPEKIAFVHCVGSRDEKCGNLYCSKVCCITGVKQAIELKEKLIDVDVYCFYMDMRMFDPYFEELYMEAQQKYGVQFIRGRISEACENINNRITIKAEDTLIGRPIKMDVDMLVLLAGMTPSEGTIKFTKMLNVEFGKNGFIKSVNENLFQHITSEEGVYMAGTCSGPKTINDSLNSARASSLEIIEYLNNN